MHLSQGEGEMDFGHDDVKIFAEEDRLSSLPDDLIHQILSFIDMKFAVQTSSLSKRWKLVWTSMPFIKISSGCFPTLTKLSKFVTHVLSHRNHRVKLSSVNLHFTGEVSQVFVRWIVVYALSRNVQEIKVYCSPRHQEFSLPLFSSRSLERLSLRTHLDAPCITPTAPWDLPRLTTLHLSQITLGDDNTTKPLDLFSKCVNLKNLTLHHVTVLCLGVFNICNPQLSNLILRDVWIYPKVLNVVAPQLQNLSISNCSAKYRISAPGLSTFSFKHCRPLQFSTDGFHSLDIVNLCLNVYSPSKEKDARKIVGLLQVFYSAKFLTLNSEVIESLSSYPDLLSHETSPFINLKHVKIYLKELVNRNPKNVTVPSQVRNYFLDNSPSAIMDLPEDQPKKLRKRTGKKAKSLTADLQALLKRRKERSQIVALGDLINEAVKNMRARIVRVTGPIESRMAERQMHLLSGKAQIKGYVAKLRLQVEQETAENFHLYSRIFDIQALLTFKQRAELKVTLGHLLAKGKAFFRKLAKAKALMADIEDFGMNQMDEMKKRVKELTGT